MLGIPGLGVGPASAPFHPLGPKCSPLAAYSTLPSKSEGHAMRFTDRNKRGTAYRDLLFADGGGQCLNWGGVYALFRVAPEARWESLKWGYHCRLCIFEKGEKY